MKAIIAEKPSVAREIAAIVGASKKEDGYLEGNGYLVTWALGHLVGLAMPEAYGFTGFQRENLPIIPESFQLVPRQVKADKGYKADPGALKQLKVIQSVFNRCDRIIVATDAGREGELIHRYIYTYLDCHKPFDRLWISSLTDKAIREGLQNLKQGSEYNNLYLSAKARSESDWLVGINSSQALSIAAGRGTYSLGRVQTPTLAMICKRYLENKHFVPTPFWQVKVQTAKSNISFAAISKERYEQKDKANEVLRLLQENKIITVKSVERKEVNQEPPLLYDLTTLQKEANSKHGFSADKTLSIAQKLYESKLATYPRTGSRYISADIFDEIPQLINGLKQHPRFGTYAQTMDNIVLNVRCVDNKKVTDHHALIITENPAKDISGDDKIIYEMIAGRMLEAFSQKCIKDSTSITFTCNDTVFETKGSIIKQAGWREVFNEKEEKDEEDEEEKNLPVLSEGEQLPVLQQEILEKQTKPKPLLTEASLLAAMETAGKEIENEVEREALKDCGIGTPATRAAIIETLFSREYIRRDKKSLVPTEKGMGVYEAVKDKKIANVSMTGEWENALAKIGRGEMNPDTFRQGIEVYASQITTELLESKIEGGNQRESCTCPKCKNGQVTIFPKVAKCNNESCGLTVFRNKSGKDLTDGQLLDLLNKGKTRIIKGFKSKENKPFDAIVAFDAEYKTIFQFDNSKKRKK